MIIHDNPKYWIVYIYIHIYIYIYVCMYTYIYVYVCMYIYMTICLYIYICVIVYILRTNQPSLALNTAHVTHRASAHPLRLG